MKKNNNNRYYCHRKLSLGYVCAKKKTIYIPFNIAFDCVYGLRLRDVYGYNVQLEIV